jgi:hypothetical protein
MKITYCSGWRQKNANFFDDNILKSQHRSCVFVLENICKMCSKYAKMIHLFRMFFRSIIADPFSARQPASQKVFFPFEKLSKNKNSKFFIFLFPVVRTDEIFVDMFLRNLISAQK